MTSPQHSTAFDAVGNVLTQTDPLGNVTTFEYDNLNRLIERTDPDPDGGGSLSAPVTTFAYNAVGSLTSLTDPVGNMTTWTLDNLQRVTSETNELNDTRSWVFDAAGNVTKVTDRNGRIREFTLDGLNRITQEVWKNGTTTVRTITQAFDAASQLLSTLDASSELAYTYDNLGRVTSIDNDGTPDVPNVVLTNTFDAASRRTTLSATIDTDDDFLNSYQYDHLGRMTQVTQQGQEEGNTVAEKRVDLTYHANGQFSTLTRYADLDATALVATTTYSFDQANRLTSLTHAQGSTTLAAYSWTFDANSRITAATTPDGTVSYSYDNNGQLTGADHSAQTDETYAYDANGNRTMSGYTTGTNNRLTSDGTNNYTYDDEGNRTRKTNISSGNYVEYSWDHRNRLTAVTFKTSSDVTTKRVEYTYDTLNRRISKSVDDNGNATIDRAEYFVYDSSGKPDPNVGVPLDDIVLVFLDADGEGSGLSSLTSRLLHGPAIDQVFSTESNTNEVLWSLTDHQGTVRDVAEYDSGTDTTTIVNHIKYDSFGQIISQSNSSYHSHHTYTGREWDADANLFYYRARWYDPVVGRFITEDPLGFAAGDTNISRYVGNGVIHKNDPSGFEDLPLGDLTREEMENLAQQMISPPIATPSRISLMISRPQPRPSEQVAILVEAMRQYQQMTVAQRAAQDALMQQLLNPPRFSIGPITAGSQPFVQLINPAVIAPSNAPAISQILIQNGNNILAPLNNATNGVIFAVSLFPVVPPPGFQTPQLGPTITTRPAITPDIIEGIRLEGAPSNPIPPLPKPPKSPPLDRSTEPFIDDDYR